MSKRTFVASEVIETGEVRRSLGGRLDVVARAVPVAVGVRMLDEPEDAGGLVSVRCKEVGISGEQICHRPVRAEAEVLGVGFHHVIAGQASRLTGLGHGAHRGLEESIEAVVSARLLSIVVVLNLPEDLVDVLGPGLWCQLLRP